MAANISPTSVYVSSYKDKTDDWLKARLAIMEDKEKVSQQGSIPRRKEIRDLRKELLTRKKAAEELAGTLAAGASPPSAPVLNMTPAAGRMAPGKFAAS